MHDSVLLFQTYKAILGNNHLDLKGRDNVRVVLTKAGLVSLVFIVMLSHIVVLMSREGNAGFL